MKDNTLLSAVDYDKIIPGVIFVNYIHLTLISNFASKKTVSQRILNTDYPLFTDSSHSRLRLSLDFDPAQSDKAASGSEDDFPVLSLYGH